MPLVTVPNAQPNRPLSPDDLEGDLIQPGHPLPSLSPQFNIETTAP